MLEITDPIMLQNIISSQVSHLFARFPHYASYFHLLLSALPPVPSECAARARGAGRLVVQLRNVSDFHVSV